MEFHHYLIELFRQETIDQRILGTSSFSLRTPVVVFSTTAVSAPFIASALLRLQLPFLLLLLWLYCLVGAARCAECSHCTVLSFFLLFLFFTISHPSASSARLRVSSTLSSSRACSACERLVLGKGAKVLIGGSAQGICPPHPGR